MLLAVITTWLLCLRSQVPDIVRSIEAERVMALRQQSQLLWHMYFSSIDRIIFTTLEVRTIRHTSLHRFPPPPPYIFTM